VGRKKAIAKTIKDNTEIENEIAFFILFWSTQQWIWL
jgi:hypothetical protein